MEEPLLTIQAVSRRTGLSPHVIRIWEKRYNAVLPSRTESNRRLYSSEEIERLALLRDVSRAGHTIGSIARLSTPELRKLIPEHLSPSPSKKHSHTSRTETILNDALAAVQTLDAWSLEKALKRGALQLGAQGLLQGVIAPLAHQIGELWRDGNLTAAHEHFATSVMRAFLNHSARPFAGNEGAPLLVATTPAGQLHELGALLADTLAANLGWRVVYLGASLPAAEIAGAAIQCQARAVALSLVYPADDPRLESEFARLRELLPKEIPIIAGGRVVSAYEDSLEKVHALQMRDLNELGQTLDSLRARCSPPNAPASAAAK